MSDRFPSIEEINDAGNATPDNGAGADLMNGGGGDTSDFLSRERAALGDDADQFASPQDNTVQNGEDDLLGGGGGAPHTNGAADSEDVNQFQSSFPPVDSGNEQVAPGGSITGTGPSAFHGTTTAEPEEEPDCIKQWRERRNMETQSREDRASDSKAETVKAAQESIDEFYENYNNKKEKSLAQTRKEAEEFLAKREDTTSGGTSWERIAKLVDVRGGGSKAGLGGQLEGKEKFKELLVGLMKDENAPGGKGY